MPSNDSNSELVKKMHKNETPIQSANNSPKMTLVDTPSRGKHSYAKYTLISMLASVMLLLAFAKYYYCFMIFDERFYKSNFYSWRVKYADPLMYKDTWKFIPKNKYFSNDPNNKYSQFIDRMQGQQLLFTGHPEHYPRQHKHYDSHCDHPFNDDFLEFRNKICRLYDKPLSESILTGKELLTDKKMLYWAGKEGNFVEEAYSDAPRRIKEFMNAFTIFLNKLHDGKYKKTGLVANSCPEEIVDDFEKMSKAAGLDLSREYLSELPNKFGLVKSKTIENFGYSRMFYLFYLCTLDCKIDTLGELNSGKKDESAKEAEERNKALEKQKKKPGARIETVSTCFTELMSNLYEHDFGEGRKQLNGLHSVMIRGFGVPDAKRSDQTKNIDILMKELNSIVRPERSE